MDVTHALAAGMGGIRTAGDLVARMQMSRGMRLKEAKEYVAGKLGCTARDLSDSYAMEQIRGRRAWAGSSTTPTCTPASPTR